MNVRSAVEIRFICCQTISHYNNAMRVCHPPAGRRESLVFLAAAFVLLISTACSAETLQASYLQSHSAQLSTPASLTPQPGRFVVPPGTTARGIAQQLQAAGLIKDAQLFEAYVRINGLSERLQAGAYTLSPSMTIPEIAQALQQGRPDSLTVTVPEGWRVEQVGDYLKDTGLLDGATYRQMASGDLAGLDPSAYGFLDLRPKGASLEGYLFPDTYSLPLQGATASDLVKDQLDNFATQVLPAYQQAFAGGTTNLTLHEVLTLASIVEREAVFDDERPVIAGVYLNRLAQDMRLQADPTVQYGMGFQAKSGQWWKTPVSLDEYATVDSRYNTYIYPGLPPGPICNPGLASIQAALNPAKHDYLYFVAIPGTGRHAFARTYEEHLANVNRYQNK
jgi:UPF0755 protein